MDFRNAYDPGRALRGAWGLYSRWPLLFVGALLVFLTDVDTSFSSSVNFERADGDMRWSLRGPLAEVWERWEQWQPEPGIEPLAWGVLLLAVVFALLLAVALLLLNTLLFAGYAGAVERASGGVAPSFGDLLDTRGRFLKVLGTRLLVWLVSALVAAPFVALGFLVSILMPSAFPLLLLAALILWLPIFVFVALGLSLATFASALEGLGPVEAVRRSWSLASGNRILLFLYYAVFYILKVIGVCMCCVGVFFTGPWTTTAQFESYLQLVRPLPQPTPEA